jgi:hypothetical protein
MCSVVLADVSCIVAREGSGFVVSSQSMEYRDESDILAGERMRTKVQENSPLLEAQISDTFASVDTRDGAGEKGGESQYGLKGSGSVVTELVRSNGKDMATNLVERLIRKTNKGNQAK